MENYPILGIIKRYGKPGSFVLAAAVLLTIATLAWPFSPAVAIGCGIGAGALTLVLSLSYVELIRLIAATLMPE